MVIQYVLFFNAPDGFIIFCFKALLSVLGICVGCGLISGKEDVCAQNDDMCGNRT